jgi:hypothetical protein
MRTLYEIIAATRDGERPEYDELRYAVCALESLSTFDGMAFRKLATAERDGQKPFLTRSAVFQYEEHFRRHKTALAKSPKDWVGWNNDPDNPEFLERRKSSIRLFDKVVEQAGTKGDSQ